MSPAELHACFPSWYWPSWSAICTRFVDGPPGHQKRLWRAFLWFWSLPVHFQAKRLQRGSAG
jgi:hypothetical protein